MDKNAQTIRHAMRYKLKNECGEVNDLLVGNDQELIAQLGKRYQYIEKQTQDGMTLFFGNNDIYDLKLVEVLQKTSILEKPKLNDCSVERCILERMKGTYAEGEDEGFWHGATINTNKHMFA